MSKNIKSYVMFDTESTGLPSPGNNPRITELCLIAVTREELRSKQRDQRVFNKLHLCINPCKQIHHRSAELTGLHNDSLSLQATFGKQADLVVSFLRNLPQPTCLLAHNGHHFDFPLLKAELSKCHKALSENVHCADTLQAFRSFDGLPPVPEFVAQRRMEQIAKGNKATKSAILLSNTSSGASDLDESKKLNEPSSSGRDEKTVEVKNSTIVNKRGRVDCLFMTTNSEANVKQIKLEFQNHHHQQQQQQHQNEATPVRKTSMHSTSRLCSPPRGKCNQEDSTARHVGCREGLVSHVRKRLFTSPPKLSLKSSDDSYSYSNEDLNSNKRLKGSEIILQDVYSNSYSSTSSNSGSGSRNDGDSDEGIVAEDSNSTQCYFDVDPDSSSQKSAINSAECMSLTDSDKDFLEACKEVDRLLPSGPRPNSDSNKTIRSGVVKHLVHLEDKIEITSHQSENNNSSVSIPQIEKDKDKNENASEHDSVGQSVAISTDNNNINISRSSSSPEDKKTSPQRGSRGVVSETATDKSPDRNSQKTAFKSSVVPHLQSPSGRKSYALGNLYAFHFGQKPAVLHTAEDDCITLLKLISLNVDKFFSYCDQNAVLFSGVEPMYC